MGVMGCLSSFESGDGGRRAALVRSVILTSDAPSFVKDFFYFFRLKRASVLLSQQNYQLFVQVIPKRREWPSATPCLRLDAAAAGRSTNAATVDAQIQGSGRRARAN